MNSSFKNTGQPRHKWPVVTFVYSPKLRFALKINVAHDYVICNNDEHSIFIARLYPVVTDLPGQVINDIRVIIWAVTCGQNQSPYNRQWLGNLILMKGIDALIVK